MHAASLLIEKHGHNKKKEGFKADFFNAFNLADREEMFEQVQEKAPGLCHWVNFCYENFAYLFSEDSFFLSCTGVQQGDPLGPLLFALVLHSIIFKIKEECPT